MKAEVKRRWVEALRSGKYKQGRFVLKNNAGEYCCLGVLCEVAELIDPSIDKSGQLDSETYHPLRRVLGDTQVKVLSNFNDNEGYTFNDIADYIESNITMMEEI